MGDGGTGGRLLILPPSMNNTDCFSHVRAKTKTWRIDLLKLMTNWTCLINKNLILFLMCDLEYKALFLLRGKAIQRTLGYRRAYMGRRVNNHTRTARGIIGKKLGTSGRRSEIYKQPIMFQAWKGNQHWIGFQSWITWTRKIAEGIWSELPGYTVGRIGFNVDIWPGHWWSTPEMRYELYLGGNIGYRFLTSGKDGSIFLLNSAGKGFPTTADIELSQQNSIRISCSFFYPLCSGFTRVFFRVLFSRGLKCSFGFQARPVKGQRGAESAWRQKYNNTKKWTVPVLQATNNITSDLKTTINPYSDRREASSGGAQRAGGGTEISSHVTVPGLGVACAPPAPCRNTFTACCVIRYATLPVLASLNALCLMSLLLPASFNQQCSLHEYLHAIPPHVHLSTSQTCAFSSSLSASLLRFAGPPWAPRPPRRQVPCRVGDGIRTAGAPKKGLGLTGIVRVFRTTTFNFFINKCNPISGHFFERCSGGTTQTSFCCLGSFEPTDPFRLPQWLTRRTSSFSSLKAAEIIFEESTMHKNCFQNTYYDDGQSGSNLAILPVQPNKKPFFQFFWPSWRLSASHALRVVSVWRTILNSTFVFRGFPVQKYMYSAVRALSAPITDHLRLEQEIEVHPFGWAGMARKLKMKGSHRRLLNSVSMLSLCGIIYTRFVSSGAAAAVLMNREKSIADLYIHSTVVAPPALCRIRQNYCSTSIRIFSFLIKMPRQPVLIRLASLCNTGTACLDHIDNERKTQEKTRPGKPQPSLGWSSCFVLHLGIHHTNFR
ncbi:hypothetical protein VP01_12g2 [Puccinia sorghi]|uniref:Uncharacterized protein n=1 Tax=Puccinia sorghi TaxID=27349 RepID=A0A0L6VN48_9BASI|nr:hypothetical protein VP01_12g2 [Puccinia sorghi]